MIETEIRIILAEYYPGDQLIEVDTILLWAEWATEEESAFLLIYRDTVGDLFVQEDGCPAGYSNDPLTWAPEPILDHEIADRLDGWEEDIEYNLLPPFGGGRRTKNG